MSELARSTARHRSANPEVRFFGILRESPALHFYLLQAVGFLYLAWRFASRDYTVYGSLPDAAFDFPRAYPNELWPVPPLWFTTFQFVYEFLPRPSAEGVRAMQYAVIGASLAGLLGILPRLAAAVAFAFAAHLTGMAQASNADVDGGTAILCSMLILALSPAQSFYSLRNGFHPLRRSIHHHWPLFLLFLVVGLDYSFSGLNKLVEIGPHWPFVLHLERLAAVGVEQSLFRCDRFRIPAISAAHLSYAASVVGGVVALIGEAGFLGVLFLPRYRLFFAASMVIMHFLVFAMQGINFLGSSAVILLCLDWNAPARKAQVLWDGGCGFCARTLRVLERLDWFKRLEPVEIARSGDLPVDHARLEREMAVLDENGEVYYGADAFAELATRCPLLWPLAGLLRIPGAIYAARPIYAFVARHRGHLAPGGACALPPAERDER